MSDLGSIQLYEIELWDQSGVLIADISSLCQNFHYIQKRNDVETLTFTVDLFEFESYCKDKLGGIDPMYLIKEDVTNVLVKRAGVYLFGVEVKIIRFEYLQPRKDGGYPVQIDCTGYLNYFADRYTSTAYTSKERVAIACDLINTTQAQTNGSFGVTINSTQYTTGFTDSQRTYQQDNIKTSLQYLANASDYPFDFHLDAFKVFSTYQNLGAVRGDLPTFIWGGPLANVDGFAMDRDASGLYNKITGYGSGFGVATLTSVKSDGPSQLNYFLREKPVQFNSVIVQSTLDTNTATELAQRKDSLKLPAIRINTKTLSGAWLNIGDRIQVQVNDHRWIADVIGTYRIEQLAVAVDENHVETIDVTFDNYGLV